MDRKFKMGQFGVDAETAVLRGWDLGWEEEFDRMLGRESCVAVGPIGISVHLC